MQLRLKVVGGSNDGREIVVKGEFVIGRGEGVTLRPKSDLISRKHCALYVREGRAYLKDLNSSNGSFLNGERIKGEVQVEMGDRFRVGRLQFEIVLDHTVASAKRPKVTGVKDAAVRSAKAPSPSDSGGMEDDITDWLTEADDSEKSTTEFNETRQFRLDESDRLYVPEDPSELVDEPTSEETVEGLAVAGGDETVEVPKKKGKQKPGKLPQTDRNKTENSTDAASQMLRKFFNRR